MANIKWSAEQRRIIDTRAKNLLVSAAAGAGKTTVLVERILGLISDEALGIDIDRLLVVTFTKDAAAQMREKLGERIEKLLDEEPDNRRMIRQQMLLRNAPITTIDSFCNSVVKEYFHEIDIDPSFRIGQQAELKLMQNDVLKELLEECYEKHEQRFIDMLESFCSSKNDEALERLVLRLAGAADAQAWPISWLEDLKKEFTGELSGCEGISPDKEKFMVEYARAMLEEVPGQIDYAIGLCNVERGPKAYLPALLSDQKHINDILSLKSYAEYSDLLSGLTFERLSTKKEDADETIKEHIKELRNSYKTTVDSLKKDYFSRTMSQIVEEQKITAGPIITLIDVTCEYMKRFTERKKEKNILDFGDLEHFALNILAERDEEGDVVAKTAALELRARFAEIFVDEYQDSNFVQEQIISVIAGSSPAGPYTFMVGDVKQSIYKFRMAKPELFINRCKRYREQPRTGEVISLGRNFRSRPEVLDSTNDVFFMSMRESVGGVTYDEEAALVCGQRELAGGNMPTDEASLTEVILVGPGISAGGADKTDSCSGSEETTAAGDAAKTDSVSSTVETTSAGDAAKADSVSSTEETTSAGDAGKADSGSNADGRTPGTASDALRRSEALAAAHRIKDLIESGYVVAPGTEAEHKLGFGDVVILLRSLKGWSDVYADVFQNEGIPVYSDGSAGFLDSYEISVILNYLRIIDNPRQDIPLAAVLHSAAGNFSSDELVAIRLFAGLDCPLWEALGLFASDGDDEVLRNKAAAFCSDYHELRSMNLTRDIDKVIGAIYDRTGFYNYCEALPGGARRASNLDMLLTYAADYEASSYSGLFSFVRYLGQIIDSEQDLEEAVNAEAGNSVRIMSIHKSKGLEFPVVFIGGMGRKISNMDGNQGVIISSDFGIATPAVRLDLRTRTKTFRRSVTQLMMKLDNMGEELRLLYVAMTRAKQKLIMIGSTAKPSSKQEKWEKAASKVWKAYPVSYIASADSYFDFVYPVAINRTDHFKILWGSDIRIGRAAAAREEDCRRDEFENISAGKAPEFMRLLEYVYPYRDDKALPVKLTVSDLKRASVADDEPVIESGPVKKKYKITGADRGNVYHKVMRLIPMDLRGTGAVNAFLDSLLKSGIINAEERDCVEAADIAAFMDTELCGRMLKAHANGNLRREQPFVFGKKASQIDPVRFAGIDNVIPVQGIIDCMFPEGDGYVVLDYKTDRIAAGHGHELRIKYREQLINYAEAVAQILGKPVKEVYIYSFELREVIKIEEATTVHL